MGTKEHDRTDDIAILLYFLHYMKQDRPGAMYGSHKIEDAFDAAVRLVLPGEDPLVIDKVLEDIG